MAIEFDHVGAGRFQPPARLGGAPAFARCGFAMDGEGHDGGNLAEALDRLERHQRLAAPRERLGDDVVDAGAGGPADLLFENPCDLPEGSLVARLIDIRVADVAGEQRFRLSRDLPGEGKRHDVHRLEVLLAADDAQLFAMDVVSEGLHDVRAGMDEVAVQPFHHFRVLDQHFGNERTGLQVAATLELEDVSFGANDRTRRQALHQAAPRARLDPGFCRAAHCRIFAPDRARRHAEKRAVQARMRRPLGSNSGSSSSNGLAALADDLDLEVRIGCRQRCRNVAQRHRLPRRMGIAARRDPADHLAVVPHRLVADRVGAVGIDREGHQPAGGAPVAFLRCRVATDEVVLLEVDEAIEPGFVGAIDRPVFPGPGAEALFQPQRVQRARRRNGAGPKARPASSSRS